MFPSIFHDLTSHRFTKFTVPGINSLIDQALSLIRQMLVTSTIPPLWTCGQCCCSQTLYLCRITECSSPLAVCIASLVTMRTSPQGEDFQIRPSPIPPIAVPHILAVFSITDLPSMSRRQPSTIVIAYMVLGVFWIPTNKLKGSFWWSSWLRWIELAESWC